MKDLKCKSISNDKVRYSIKRSEFIGFIEDCETLDEMNLIIKAYKKKYHNATHICYAVIFNDSYFFNEDKEPSGTAGSVILNELKQRGIVNKLIIIVRYFGGRKLGRDLLKDTYSIVTLCVFNKLLFR